MLLGAVLFTAQLGAWQIRSLLTSGKQGVMERIRPDDVGTAAQFSKALAQAPIMEGVKFASKEQEEKLTKVLLQHADDLDYLQDLISSIGKRTALNPSLNAVVQAFSRRRFGGLFKKEGQSVELDTLLQQHTITKKDKNPQGVISQTSPRFCHKFQLGRCTWRTCAFKHHCSICAALTHGASNCPKLGLLQQLNSSNSWIAARDTTNNTSRPPHPRFRRDRATNTGVF